VPGGIGERDRDLVWIERDGKVEPAIQARSISRTFALSPDGNQVVRNNTAGPGRDVWIDDLPRGTNTRITFQGDYWHSVWSTDAKWLVYAKGLPAQNLYRRRIDDEKTEERLTTSGNNQHPSSWSPDGKTVAFSEFDPVSVSDIWVVTLDGAAPRARPFLKTQFSEGGAQFSPDGRWLAYDSNESGRFEVYVRPFPQGDPKIAVSAEGGFSPIWSPHGGELFYLSPDNKMMAVTVTTGPDFRAEKPRALFDSSRYDSIYAVSPDARRFLMMPLIPAEAAPTRINLVLNWLSELRNLTR
jgi:Tol biopolymer transport system component